MFLVRFCNDMSKDGLSTGQNMQHTCQGDNVNENKPVLIQGEQNAVYTGYKPVISTYPSMTRFSYTAGSLHTGHIHAGLCSFI